MSRYSGFYKELSDLQGRLRRNMHQFRSVKKSLEKMDEEEGDSFLPRRLKARERELVVEFTLLKTQINEWIERKDDSPFVHVEHEDMDYQDLLELRSKVKRAQRFQGDLPMGRLLAKLNMALCQYDDLIEH